MSLNVMNMHAGFLVIRSGGPGEWGTPECGLRSREPRTLRPPDFRRGPGKMV